MADIVSLARQQIIDENKSFLEDKLFLEFGVMGGGSIRYISGQYDENKINYKGFGFDSFEGLPAEADMEATSGIWKKGQFKSSVSFEELQKEFKDKITLVPGWFNETLNDETLSLFKGMKAGLVHVDCDIYSSSKTVLKWLVDNDLLVDGTLIMYDDWGGHAAIREGCPGEYSCGQGLAHKEICEEYNLNFEDVSTIRVTEDGHWTVKIFKFKGASRCE